VFGILLALGARAYVPTWKDDLGLWTRVVEIEPRNHLGHLNRGLARMARGDLPGAREDITTAARLSPDSPQPRTNLGYIAAVSTPPDLSGALAHLDAALEIDPHYAPAHANRAGMMLAMQRPQDALTDIDAAIAIDGGSPEELLARAKILVALERPADAEEALRSVLALAPRGAPPAQEAQRMLATLRTSAPR
jgi:tetratricopeptide (TPR) repeat protein